eukprot:1206089-Prymnesium_polylepis.1
MVWCLLMAHRAGCLMETPTRSQRGGRRSPCDVLQTLLLVGAQAVVGGALARWRGPRSHRRRGDARRHLLGCRAGGME